MGNGEQGECRVLNGMIKESPWEGKSVEFIEQRLSSTWAYFTFIIFYLRRE